MPSPALQLLRLHVEFLQPLDRERHLVANLQLQVRGGKVNNLPPSVLMRPVLPPPPASDSLTTELWKRTRSSRCCHKPAMWRASTLTPSPQSSATHNSHFFPRKCEKPLDQQLSLLEAWPVRKLQSGRQCAVESDPRET